MSRRYPNEDEAKAAVDQHAVDAAFEVMWPGVHPNAYENIGKRIRIAEALRAAAPYILNNL